MKAKIYIETSIVSYYASRPSRDIITAARQQITREWWEKSRGQFDTYISALVLEEAEGGDPTAAAKRLAALKGIPILKISDEAEKLASVFVEHGPISETHSEDALHIALAITNGMDFLVTWNFHHINNAILKKELLKISGENGYECPMICSLEEIEGA